MRVNISIFLLLFFLGCSSKPDKEEPKGLYLKINHGALILIPTEVDTFMHHLLFSTVQNNTDSVVSLNFWPKEGGLNLFQIHNAPHNYSIPVRPYCYTGIFDKPDSLICVRSVRRYNDSTLFPGKNADVIYWLDKFQPNTCVLPFPPKHHMPEIIEYYKQNIVTDSLGCLFKNKPIPIVFADSFGFHFFDNHLDAVKQRNPLSLSELMGD